LNGAFTLDSFVRKMAIQDVWVTVTVQKNRPGDMPPGGEEGKARGATTTMRGQRDE
jgi:hypothetical protein